MLEKLVTRSVNYLLRNNAIFEEDRDIFLYGFHSLYSNILSITAILLISILLNQVQQTILYHISFILLRNTAGGFHAKTLLRCFVMSMIIWLLSLWCIQHIAKPLVCIWVAGAAKIIVWKTAPVEHENSPLNEFKRRRMKLLSKIVSACLFISILLILTIRHNNSCWVAGSLAFGMATHAILVLAALYQLSAKKEQTTR